MKYRVAIFYNPERSAFPWTVVFERKQFFWWVEAFTLIFGTEDEAIAAYEYAANPEAGNQEYDWRPAP